MALEVVELEIELGLKRLGGSRRHPPVVLGDAVGVVVAAPVVGVVVAPGFVVGDFGAVVTVCGTVVSGGTVDGMVVGTAYSCTSDLFHTPNTPTATITTPLMLS